MEMRTNLYIVEKSNLLRAESERTKIIVLTNANTLIPPKQTFMLFGQEFQVIIYYDIDKMLDELKQILVIS